MSMVATHQHEHLYTSCRHLSCSLGVTQTYGQEGMTMQLCVFVFQAELTASDVCTLGHMHTVVNVLDHETVFIK